MFRYPQFVPHGHGSGHGHEQERAEQPPDFDSICEGGYTAKTDDN